MINLQDSPIDRALYYRGDAGSTSLFDASGGYRKKAYAFKATGMMLDTPQRLAVTAQGLAVLAGRSRDGRKVQILICNFNNAPGYALAVTNLPWGNEKFRLSRYRITQTENFTQVGQVPDLPRKLEITSDLPAPGVELIVAEFSQ